MTDAETMSAATTSSTTSGPRRRGRPPAKTAHLRSLVESIKATRARTVSEFFTLCEALLELTTDCAWREVYPQHHELDAFCKHELGCSASWAQLRAHVADILDRKTVAKIGIARTRVVSRVPESKRQKALDLALKGYNATVIQDKILGLDPERRRFASALRLTLNLDHESRARLIAELQLAQKNEITSRRDKRERVQAAMAELKG